MRSMHLIDPELRPVIDAFPPLALSRDVLPRYREAAREQLAKRPPPDSPHTRVEEVSVPGPAGAPPVRALLFRPTTRGAEALPAVLHIHGGGYVLGSPETNADDNHALVAALGCLVLSVDYRLAPDTPHPGPLEDCYAALAWLHANATELGIDPQRIGVKGESAGGGLAAALALLARDTGDYPLAFQHLIYPMLDDRTCALATPSPYAGEFIWDRPANLFGWTSLLGAAPGGPDAAPYAAAGRAADLEGLPPTYLAVGAIELFLEENLEYARRLGRAGVPLELHVYPGAFHGFDALAPNTAVSTRARTDSRDALRRVMQPQR